MTCPSCGAEVRDIDRFCSECGSALEAKINDAPCRACGQMVPLGAKFCGNCGASEPHSVPAGATGETVVARAPVRPGSELPEAGAPSSEDEDTGVFQRMIEEELEATSTVEVRRGSGKPRAVGADPTQEHHLGKPVGFALAGKDTIPKRKAKRTDKSPAVAGPKRPVGLAKSPRPKPAATGAKPSRPAEPADEEIEIDIEEETDDVAGIWPDITEEIAEVRFYLLQGLEDDALAALAGLKDKHGLHPELAAIETEIRGESPRRDKSRKRKAKAKKPEPKAASPSGPEARETAAPPADPARPDAPASGTTAPPAAIGSPPGDAASRGTAPPGAMGSSAGEAASTAGPSGAGGSPEGEGASTGEQGGIPPRGRGARAGRTVPMPEAGVSIGRVAVASASATEAEGVEAKPAAPARTGVTAPMSKPAEAKQPSSRAGTRPPPPPPGVTPRSTPSVPPLRKPAPRSQSEAKSSSAPPPPMPTVPAAGDIDDAATKSAASVPPPPMPTVPSAGGVHASASRSAVSVPPPPMPVVPPASDPAPAASDSASAMEVSGEVEVPRGETVVAAYHPLPPRPAEAEDIAPAIEHVDRTVIAPAPGPGEKPGPPPPAPHPSKPAPARTTVVPTSAAPDRPPPPAPFGGEPAPGSTLVPGTAPPPGGFPDADDDPATAVARHVEPSGTPRMPMAEPKEPEHADAEREPEPEPEPRNETVIAANPLLPAPYDGEIPTTLPPVQTIRLVMLGSRGQTVAERTLRPGDSLDVGRDPVEPWGDDEHLEENHARITPAAGGVIVDDYDGTGPVFRQVSERTRIRPGDQLRVGQSLIQYEHGEGNGFGRLLVFTGGEQPPRVHALGGGGATVGREDGDITFLHDTYVSGEHCRFVCEGSHVYVEDTGSSNGTYVRVRQGEPVELGALLLLGHTQFRIRPA